MNTPVSLLAFLALFSIPPAVFGHGYLKSPRSRNFAAYQDGRGEYEPWSANKKSATDTCGTINGRNYDFFPSGIQATYSSGQTVDFDVDMTAHHKGHFVLKACPISPGQTATQACFDRNPLRFVSGENANPDPTYPDRAYLPPANPPNAPNGAHPQFASGGRWSYRYKFQLPQGLSGDLVLLQWHYITANSCLPPGYNTYNWPAGWNPGNLPTCVDIPADGAVGGNRPEQFWNCAEVRITAATNPTPTPPTPTPPTSGGSLGDWTVCSTSSQCRNGCCSGTYSGGVFKCTPLNGGFNPSICTGGPPPTPTPPTSGGTCGGGNRGNGVCANGQCCSQVSLV